MLTLWTKGSSWMLVWIDSWLLPMPELTKEFWCLIVSSMAKLSLNSFIAWNNTLFVERSTDVVRISLASSYYSSISEFSVSENEILCVVNVCSRTLSGSSLPWVSVLYATIFLIISLTCKSAKSWYAFSRLDNLYCSFNSSSKLSASGSKISSNLFYITIRSVVCNGSPYW